MLPGSARLAARARKICVLRVNNLMRPLAIPTAGGFVSALMLFGVLAPSLAIPPVTRANDVPTVLYTEASVKNFLPIGFEGDGDLVVEITVDENGKLVDYSIPNMDDKATRMHRSIENQILFTQFTPATRLRTADVRQSKDHVPQQPDRRQRLIARPWPDGGSASIFLRENRFSNGLPRQLAPTPASYRHRNRPRQGRADGLSCSAGIAGDRGRGGSGAGALSAREIPQAMRTSRSYTPMFSKSISRSGGRSRSPAICRTTSLRRSSRRFLRSAHCCCTRFFWFSARSPSALSPVRAAAITGFCP